jgi:HD-GYP domain-containing protein (c-di-GMP phosphodiesterase class II)
MSEIREELTSDELLKLLFSYSGKIADCRKLESILILMNDLGRQLVVSDRCTLWLLDSNKNEIWTAIADGVGQMRMPKDKGIAGQCLSEGQKIIINNPYCDTRFNSEMDKSTGYQTRSILAVPIFKNDGTLMGVYQAINKMTSNGEFTEADVERLTMAATFSGKSIESAYLNQEVEATQLELVHMLGEAGESRSRETGNHVKRVGEFAFVLARAKGLNPSECELIRLAAPLHDLGKVAIPDAILNKPGKLTEEEFEIMKHHAKIGYEILVKSPRKILNAAAVIAYQHQEKFNGTGYPQKLAGRAEEHENGIHLWARIAAIADVFDALSHDRCYKKAWPIEKVHSFFLEERCEHFDPELVDLLFANWAVFLNIMNEFKDEFEEHKG